MAVEKIRREEAISSTTADILLVALTVLLIAIFLAALMGMFSESHSKEKIPPEIFKIVDVTNVSNGIVKIEHVGTEAVFNSEHSAVVYIDGVKKNIVITTLSAHEFISTKHYDIRLIKGSGPTGYLWAPGETGVFDFENGIIRHNCVLRIDIIRNSDNEIYSRSEFSVK